MIKESTTLSRAADYLEGVTIALKMGESLDFTLPERARMMGFMGVVGDNPDYLDRQLKLMDGQAAENVGKRVSVIIEIMAKLEGLFDEKIDMMKHWVNVKFRQAGGASIKELMVSGDMAKLHEALAVLTRITG